jgi:hypothetical protein
MGPIAVRVTAIAENWKGCRKMRGITASPDPDGTGH